MTRRTEHLPGRKALFSPMARRIVMTVSAISAIATIVGLLFGAKLHGVTPGPVDSFGGSPIGHRLFAETFIALGYNVTQNRSNHFTSPAPMLFLEPRSDGRAGGYEHALGDVLGERLAEGLPTILVLPKWSFGHDAEGAPVLVPSGDAQTIMSTLGVLPGGSLQRQSGTTLDTLEGPLGQFAIDVPALQVASSLPDYTEVLLESPQGAVVIRANYNTVIVTDPDLLHSYNFHRADHADLWAAILERGFLEPPPRALVLDEVFHGHGTTYSVARALSEFPAVLLVIHLVMLFLFVFAAGSLAFGPPPDSAPRRHGPSEAIGISAGLLAEGEPAGVLTLRYICELIAEKHATLGFRTANNFDRQAKDIDEAAARRGIFPDAERLLSQARRLTGLKRPSPAMWALVRRAEQFVSLFDHGVTPTETEDTPSPEAPIAHSEDAAA